ncbi:hypothetical protein B0H14DRAFT_2563220 [Mycena olivaceomarginata]|nr:hypothetical protein B0H14DRAFT_2563220 [Mycena olivaceomarginata]
MTFSFDAVPNFHQIIEDTIKFASVMADTFATSPPSVLIQNCAFLRCFSQYGFPYKFWLARDIRGTIELGIWQRQLKIFTSVHRFNVRSASRAAENWGEGNHCIILPPVHFDISCKDMAMVYNHCSKSQRKNRHPSKEFVPSVVNGNLLVGINILFGDDESSRFSFWHLPELNHSIWITAMIDVPREVNSSWLAGINEFLGKQS